MQGVRNAAIAVALWKQYQSVDFRCGQVSDHTETHDDEQTERLDYLIDEAASARGSLQALLDIAEQRGILDENGKLLPIFTARS